MSKKVTLEKLIQEFRLEVIYGWDQLDRAVTSRICTGRDWSWQVFSLIIRSNVCSCLAKRNCPLLKD